MTHHGPSSRAGHRTRPWAMVSALLAVVAVVCVGIGVRHHRADDEQATPAGPWFQVETPLPVAAPAPASPPVRLRIRTIGVSTTVVRLGLNKDKTVEVPTNPSQAGWYRLGTSPGQPGSAVILGHVDSLKGAAVFYRLRSLVEGDVADVLLADGSRVDFAVTRVVTYQNRDFPKRKVYGNTGSPRLTLITCGGDYDRSAGGYQANVVVFTRLLRNMPHPG